MPLNTNSIIVKAKAYYQCERCGSPDIVQAHHQIAGDDSSMICLCADCHSKEHPRIPRLLFFSISNQPYWYNMSASALAREIDVCSRTIIRRAKRLKISSGFLSEQDKIRIINFGNNWVIPYTDATLLFTCPNCGHEMHKAGFRWSGQNRRQAWRCPNCGKVSIVPKFKGGNTNETA